ncbi:MAG: hypothetical protein HY829_03555 [Actinobacteria bacterium]|nr:hypothetical protein [Actinomycetota bacterium]
MHTVSGVAVVDWPRLTTWVRVGDGDVVVAGVVGATVGVAEVGALVGAGCAVGGWGTSVIRAAWNVMAGAVGWGASGSTGVGAGGRVTGDWSPPTPTMLPSGKVTRAEADAPPALLWGTGTLGS